MGRRKQPNPTRCISPVKGEKSVSTTVTPKKSINLSTTTEPQRPSTSGEPSTVGKRKVPPTPAESIAKNSKSSHPPTDCPKSADSTKTSSTSSTAAKVPVKFNNGNLNSDFSAASAANLFGSAFDFAAAQKAFDVFMCGGVDESKVKLADASMMMRPFLNLYNQFLLDYTSAAMVANATSTTSAINLSSSDKNSTAAQSSASKRSATPLFGAPLQPSSCPVSSPTRNGYGTTAVNNHRNNNTINKNSSGSTSTNLTAKNGGQIIWKNASGQLPPLIPGGAFTPLPATLIGNGAATSQPFVLPALSDTLTPSSAAFLESLGALFDGKAATRQRSGGTLSTSGGKRCLTTSESHPTTIKQKSASDRPPTISVAKSSVNSNISNGSNNSNDTVVLDLSVRSQRTKPGVNTTLVQPNAEEHRSVLKNTTTTNPLCQLNSLVIAAGDDAVVKRARLASTTGVEPTVRKCRSTSPQASDGGAPSVTLDGREDVRLRCESQPLPLAMWNFLEPDAALNNGNTVAERRPAADDDAVSRIFTCLRCGERFPALDALVRHMQKTRHYHQKQKNADDGDIANAARLLRPQTATVSMNGRAKNGMSEYLSGDVVVAKPDCFIVPPMTDKQRRRAGADSAVTTIASSTNGGGSRPHATTFGFECILCGHSSINDGGESESVEAHMTGAHSFRQPSEWLSAVKLIPHHQSNHNHHHHQPAGR